MSILIGLRIYLQFRVLILIKTLHATHLEMLPMEWEKISKCTKKNLYRHEEFSSFVPFPGHLTDLPVFLDIRGLGHCSNHQEDLIDSDTEK